MPSCMLALTRTDHAPSLQTRPTAPPPEHTHVIHHYDLLALGAATCWAASGMLSATPSKALGAIAFVRWRMMTVALLLWALVAPTGTRRWQRPQHNLANFRVIHTKNTF
jgi:hypothetical protein